MKNIIDEVLGLVNVPPFILELIDTKEFQRLRRIKQLGGASLVFIGANHTRFQHSIGVYANLTEIKQKNLTHKFSEKEWNEIFIAGLLHDLGHGPLSHSLEVISNHKLDHEEMGKKILLDKNSEVNKVLLKNNFNPQNIVDLFSPQKHPLKSSLLSSTVDVDRMDYLLRDAHHTGTQYGKHDKNKIISSMILNQNKLIFKSSAIPAIESFLWSRFQSFKTIYLHRTTIIYQEMYTLLFARLKDLKNDAQYQKHWNKIGKLLENKITIKEFIKFDDESFGVFIENLSETSDPIIKELAYGIRNRQFFKAYNYSYNLKKDILKKLKEKKLDPRYFLREVKIKKYLYNPDVNGEILVASKENNGKKEISSICEKSSFLQKWKNVSYNVHLLIYPKYIFSKEQKSGQN